MAEAILYIKRWGKDIGVRLPAAVAREANLRVDQRVRVFVEEERVVIEPVSTPATLEQRLAAFDPARHGGEGMAPRATRDARGRAVRRASA